MYIRVNDPADNKSPGQVKHRGSDRIDAVKHKTQHIKQHRHLELVADIIGYH